MLFSFLFLLRFHSSSYSLPLDLSLSASFNQNKNFIWLSSLPAYRFLHLTTNTLKIMVLYASRKKKVHMESNKIACSHNNFYFIISLTYHTPPQRRWGTRTICTAQHIKIQSIFDESFIKKVLHFIDHRLNSTTTWEHFISMWHQQLGWWGLWRRQPRKFGRIFSHMHVMVDIIDGNMAISSFNYSIDGIFCSLLWKA